MTLIIDTDAPSATRQHLREPPDPALARQRVKLRDRAGLIRGEAIVAAIDGNDLILTDLRELPEEDRFRSEGGISLTAWGDPGAITGGRRQLRPEQQEFRRRLLDAYGGRCAVTDCDVEAALEAAHLRDFRTSNEVRKSRRRWATTAFSTASRSTCPPAGATGPSREPRPTVTAATRPDRARP